MLNISPIPQNPEYHNFADQRTLLGISNFWNVISNLPFIVICFIAIIKLFVNRKLKHLSPLFLSYLVFFMGVGSVGLGSAYYHLDPSNDTLFWDRLPMTIGFMAFITIIIGEYISERIALKLLFPLNLVGVASVVYWHLTEQSGYGDLRFYALVQFLPMLIIPMILIMFTARHTHSGYFWAMLGAYLIAKIVESFDSHIFNMIGLSGHTIKHVFAAAGAYILLLAIKKRMPLFK